MDKCLFNHRIHVLQRKLIIDLLVFELLVSLGDAPIRSARQCNIFTSAMREVIKQAGASRTSEMEVRVNVFHIASQRGIQVCPVHKSAVIIAIIGGTLYKELDTDTSTRLGNASVMFSHLSKCVWRNRHSSTKTK